jgi:hypothetical protein
MKIFKTLVLSLALSAALVIPVALPAAPKTVVYSETPAKTVVIKHPLANDANKFFSSGTVFNFEVYKAGSKEDLTKILASLRSDAAVENVNLGPLVGDYQGFTLTLKSAKDKAWFMSEFKKAGLSSIKLNNNPVVEVDKL